jgi:hypothetical protein
LPFGSGGRPERCGATRISRWQKTAVGMLFTHSSPSASSSDSPPRCESRLRPAGSSSTPTPKPAATSARTSAAGFLASAAAIASSACATETVRG